MNILIVDNDVSTVIALEASLKIKGRYEVSKAMGGQECLDKLRAGTGFDVVLLDIMMPDISGVDVCETMIADEKLKDNKVIMMSALPITSKDFQRTLKKIQDFRVVKAVLEKPFAMGELIKKIQEITK